MGKIVFELLRTIFCILVILVYLFAAVVLFCGMVAWFFSLMGRNRD